MESFELPVNQMEEIGKGGGGIRKGKVWLRLNYTKLYKISRTKTFNCTILFDREDELTESVQW